MKRYPAKQIKEDWVIQANNHYEKANYDKAIECCDNALAIEPKYVRAWLRKGLSLYCQCKYDEAMICFDTALETETQDFTIWKYKGETFYYQNKLDEAINCYDKALALCSDAPNVWFSKGMALGRLKKHNEAIRCFDKALALKSKDPSIWNWKAAMLIHLGRYEEAVECSDKALAIDSKTKAFWETRLMVVRKQVRIDEVIRCYDEILKLSPNKLDTLNNKVTFLIGVGENDEALRACEVMQSIKSDTWCVHLGWVLKGVVFAMQGNQDEAIACYEESKKFATDNPRMFSYQGIAYFCSQKREQSLECFREAIRYDVGVCFAKLGLGFYELSQGNADQASQLFTEAEALLATERLDTIKDFWFFRGQLLVEMQAFTEAIAAFEKVQSIESHDVPAKIQLAVLKQLTARIVSATSTNVHDSSKKHTSNAASRKPAPPKVSPMPANVPERLKAHKSILIDSDLLVTEKDSLGEGSFGVVSKATWSVTGIFKKEVAIKRFKTDEMTDEDWDSFLREVEIQSKLLSPGLVRLYGITSNAPYGMVMAFMAQGSLRQVLDQTPRDVLLWKDRLRMSLNVSVGLAYLHGEGIIHRDIKSLNILVNKKGKAKLCDFGLSAFTSEQSGESSDECKGIVGSLRWIAPEIFENAEPNPATDVYSFGVVLWELWSHKFPFLVAGRDDNLVKTWVMDGKREKFDNSTPDTPQQYIDLTNRCWQQNPKDRPTADGIVKELTELFSFFKSKKPSSPPPRPRKETIAAYEMNTRVSMGSGRSRVRPNSAAPVPQFSSRKPNVSSVNSRMNGSSVREEDPPNSVAPSPPVTTRKVTVSSGGYQFNTKKGTVSAPAPLLPPRKPKEDNKVSTTKSASVPQEYEVPGGSYLN